MKNLIVSPIVQLMLEIWKKLTYSSTDEVF